LPIFDNDDNQMQSKFRIRLCFPYFDNRKSKIQNRKWAAIFAIMLTCACGDGVAKAQQPTKTFRIGYLSPVDATRESARSEPIRQALRELGYIEGHNIAIEYRYAEGKANRYPELAAELVRLKVDIIVVVGGGRLILAAKNATKTIPIVMGGAVIDPVEAGVIDSLARPPALQTLP
jgi:putative ABC transport system substrate-binding protein